MEFKDLKGKELLGFYINEFENELYIKTTDCIFKLYHSQDCCESVYLEEFTGIVPIDIPQKILSAEEITKTNGEDIEEVIRKKGEDSLEAIYNLDILSQISSNDESFTYTFYKINTIFMDIHIRWYGSSNGYYSEGVSISQVGEFPPNLKLITEDI